MSGADFFATSVVSLGALRTSAASTGVMIGRPPSARLARFAETAEAVLFTSSERPVTDAVTPTIAPPLPTRNVASFAGRRTSLTSGLSALRIAFSPTVGPYVPPDQPKRIQRRTVVALMVHFSLPAMTVTSPTMAFALSLAAAAASVEMTGGIDTTDSGTVTLAGVAGSRRAAMSAVAVEASSTARPRTASVRVKPGGDAMAPASVAG